MAIGPIPPSFPLPPGSPPFPPVARFRTLPPGTGSRFVRCGLIKWAGEGTDSLESRMGGHRGRPPKFEALPASRSQSTRTPHELSCRLAHTV